MISSRGTEVVVCLVPLSISSVEVVTVVSSHAIVSVMLLETVTPSGLVVPLEVVLPAVVVDSVLMLMYAVVVSAVVVVAATVLVVAVVVAAVVVPSVGLGVPRYQTLVGFPKYRGVYLDVVVVEIVVVV